jgi:hypothetical protein
MAAACNAGVARMGQSPTWDNSPHTMVKMWQPIRFIVPWGMVARTGCHILTIVCGLLAHVGFDPLGAAAHMR